MPIAVLAYSGGLDTTYCLAKLQEEGYTVHAVLVDTGGFSPETVADATARATQLQVAHFEVLDRKQAFYHRVLRFLLFGNVLKHQTYPLSVSAERVIQAEAVAMYAKRVGAAAVAHGSTGAGNDQVRFDLVFGTLLPGVPILTPIRDKSLSRQATTDYLKGRGLEIPAKQTAYSVNQGLWGTTVGGAETLNSVGVPPETAYPVQVTQTKPLEIEIGFECGEPTQLNNEAYRDRVSLLQALEAIAAPYGIGREVHVGDTIVGIKGRVAFQASAAWVLIKAHALLEKHTLTKYQLQHKEQLALWYGNLLHEGLFLEPALRDLEAYLASSQAYVSGTVHLRLHPYRLEPLGVVSPTDLLQSRFGAYGEMPIDWTGADVRGFARIFGTNQRLHASVHPKPADSDG